MGRFDFPYNELDVLEFARAMIRGGFGWRLDPEDRCYAILDVVEESWKWRVELDAWVAAGRPESFDPDEALTKA